MSWDFIIIYPVWIFWQNICYTYQNNIPVIAFIEKAAKEEIYNNLLAEGFEVIEPQYTKKNV